MLVEAPGRMCHFIADLNLVSAKKESEAVLWRASKQEGLYSGSRLHGMEVVWCHWGGKGHREDSATGTTVCFVYTGNYQSLY